jgi:hypothetical protein
VLRLLRLAPEVLKAIAALGDPLPSPIVTERRLRPLVNLPQEEQRRRVDALLAVVESLERKESITSDLLFEILLNQRLRD